MNSVLKTAVFLPCLVSVSAFAAKSVVQPNEGEKACFVREYSAEHMRENPKQKLSTMYVLVSKTRETTEHGTFDANITKVIGTSRGKYFLNEAWCDYKADGSTSCAIDCDGGAFNLKPRATDVLFRVAPNYYFPLYRHGTDRITATPDQTVSLEANDGHNAIYKLYPADARTCEAALERATLTDGGC